MVTSSSCVGCSHHYPLVFFTYIGQTFMAVFRDSQTAQGFGSLLIAMSSVFAGMLIHHPQDIKPFWIWAYWVFPLHYVLEGLMTSQFESDEVW
jgi:ABC-type multidrug transport system permease subunit